MRWTYALFKADDTLTQRIIILASGEAVVAKTAPLWHEVK